MLILFVKFIHLMSLVVWIGSIIFFSFFGAPSIFKVLERELAGNLVGNIFPKYWMIGYICSTVAIGSLLLLWKMGTSSAIVRTILLSIMMIITFYTGLRIGPMVREAKTQMRATEDVEKKEELRQRFLKIHRRSSEMNVTILILGIVTIFMTAYHLRI
ncbi:MAG: hypothetical protein SCARUB_00255 [Candidatus Scalindua rubra]|uniref:TMEM205-like domain-containing protein n=1 Tax=Candidatus Scalindua rubra TaxID=1872076 RepID=A0A1E3XGB8_9BACT|nr:MAG: hypothetical protein SCARUB_00255 [Candidatus Scalindua rubra]